MRSPIGLLLTVVALCCPALAQAEMLPYPTELGDLSLGIGPAFVSDRGEAGGGVTAEANLLFGLFSLGAHARAAAVDGAFRPAAGLELGFAGLLGLGASAQQEGLSIDGLLALPIPLGREPFFLSVGWRPSFLLRGGVVHELAVQIRWSSLLVSADDY